MGKALVIKDSDFSNCGIGKVSKFISLEEIRIVTETIVDEGDIEIEYNPSETFEKGVVLNVVSGSEHISIEGMHVVVLSKEEVNITIEAISVYNEEIKTSSVIRVSKSKGVFDNASFFVPLSNGQIIDEKGGRRPIYTSYSGFDVEGVSFAETGNVIDYDIRDLNVGAIYAEFKSLSLSRTMYHHLISVGPDTTSNQYRFNAWVNSSTGRLGCTTKGDATSIDPPVFDTVWHKMIIMQNNLIVDGIAVMHPEYNLMQMNIIGIGNFQGYLAKDRHSNCKFRNVAIFSELSYDDAINLTK